MSNETQVKPFTTEMFAQEALAAASRYENAAFALMHTLESDLNNLAERADKAGLKAEDVGPVIEFITTRLATMEKRYEAKRSHA